MTQNQRGPTCGCTSIAVAYRILTGWTVFPTKGNFRQFSHDRLQIDLQKGNENILSVREAAKFDDVTTAGEIVNADDMVTVIKRHAEGVGARVVEVSQRTAGESFLAEVRSAFDRGMAPIVLFYIDGKTDNIGRKYDFQHWVNIFAVERKGKWLYTPITNLSSRDSLSLSDKPTSPGEMLVWTWGRQFVVDGQALGEASALSINWAEPPRMWQKDKIKNTEWRDGDLNWEEISPKDQLKYVAPKSKSIVPTVRYTTRLPSRKPKARGLVVMYRR
jgi:hypothetical protein